MIHDTAYTSLRAYSEWFCGGKSELAIEEDLSFRIKETKSNGRHWRLHHKNPIFVAERDVFKRSSDV